LLLSFGVCVAAAGQADLPRRKKLWWSRPLVALLFFLQPIVRGWARYRGRLTRRPVRPGPMDNLDSLALRKTGVPMREVAYWSERRFSRFEWVANLLRDLDAAGWPNKADMGWGDFDVEIYGSRWSTVQLTTLVEEHPAGKQMLRCRLGSRWSLQAKVAFWVMAG